MEALKKTAEYEAKIKAMPGRLAGHGLRFSDHVRRAAFSAWRNGCVTTAKAVAYSAMFAIFPALLAAAAFVSLLPEMAPLRFELALFFNNVLPPSVAPLLEDFFINADKSTVGTSALVVAGLVGFTGTAGVVAALMEGFRRAYDIPFDAWTLRRRRLRSYSLLFVSILPLSIASLLIVFGHFITQLALQWKQPELHTVFAFTMTIVRWIISLSATASVFAILYRYGTPKELSWRDVYPGASFATATWFITTVAFGFYVTHFADYSRVYGSVGTGIVLMVWLFLTALSILCGAELNAELAGKEEIFDDPVERMRV